MRRRMGLAMVGAAMALAIAIPSCGLIRQDPSRVDLAEIMPPEARLQRVQRLDADGDGGEEWVALYRFDLKLEDDGDGPGPIGGAVYKASSGLPPSLLAYPLTALDSDYLGEEEVWAEVKDLVPDEGGRAELAVYSGAGRGEEPAFSLGLFRWTPEIAEDVNGDRPDRAGSYACVGFFRGSGGVRQDGGRVMVLDRSGMERSQLAIRKVYEPVEGSYLSPGGDRLRDPVEQSVDFAFGMPASPAQSPYPEKAVLAFYLALGHDNDTARSYLSDASGYKADMGAYEYGTGAPLGSLKRALVKSIGYTPDENAEARHEDRLVSVVVAPVGEGGAIVDEAGVPVTTQVDWVVRWERLDAGDGEPAYGWRLLQYTVS